MQALVLAALLFGGGRISMRTILCAVPLHNVLKPGTPPIDQIFKRPPSPSIDTHFVVAPPAPSCDDVR